MSKEHSRGKVLIVGTNMMNIYHHRLELIKTLVNSGFNVVVAAPRGGEEKNLDKVGCQFRHIDVDNRGTNIKRDLKLIMALRKLYSREAPDVILTFYTKTNIYGGLVARFMKIPYVENITGLGTSLSKGTGKIYAIMSFLYRNAVKKSRLVFFQNESNRDFFHSRNLYRGRSRMLPGSGVSLERYPVLPYPESDSVEFLFVSRILKEKGIEEYIYAADKIKEKYPDTVFHVVGPCDEKLKEKVEDAAKAGLVSYHGKLYDLHDMIRRTHCTVLPSYYPEGMANVLLESSASGRPVITTALPGCGETVDHEVTGYVVRERDGESLAAAIERFILLDGDDKEKMGMAARKKMEREFNRDIVTREYMDIINEILAANQ